MKVKLTKTVTYSCIFDINKTLDDFKRYDDLVEYAVEESIDSPLWKEEMLDDEFSVQILKD